MAISTLDQTNTLESEFEQLYPLPLTIMETFLVTDARPGYPMLIDLELKFQGCIDRGAFAAALNFALARNPLFTCQIERDSQGRLVWIPTNQAPVVDWADEGVPYDDHYDKFIDLTREIGLRIWVRYSLEKTSVLLHFHHACADGIGAILFAEDILAGYANAYAQNEVISARAICPRRLAKRGEVGTANRSTFRRILDAIHGAREGIVFALQKPKPLEIGKQATSSSPENRLRPGYITGICPKEDYVSLRKVATSQKATVNDLLMRDLFLTLRRWNADHNPRSDRGNLRIMMPQNLRTRDDREMPAANVMSVSFLTRKNSLCNTPEKLLRSLQVETEAVRHGQLSVYTLGALATVQSAGMLEKMLRDPTCLSTAVLTNVGDPSRRFIIRLPRTSEGLVVGNLVFQGIAGVPPLRPLTRAALSVVTSAKSIILSLKCDPQSHSPADAQQLLNDYLAQIHATAHGKSYR